MMKSRYTIRPWRDKWFIRHHYLWFFFSDISEDPRYVKTFKTPIEAKIWLDEKLEGKRCRTKARRENRVYKYPEEVPFDE